MKTLLTILSTLFLFNNAYACSLAPILVTTDSYCFPDRSGVFPNSTGKLERRAVCSVSEDAIAAQAELAQRYRSGYYPKSKELLIEAIIPMKSLGCCPCPSPKVAEEIAIHPNPYMADYWDKFSYITKTVLLAQNGDKNEQLRLARIYLDNEEEYQMVNSIRVVVTPINANYLIKDFTMNSFTEEMLTLLDYSHKVRELKARYWYSVLGFSPWNFESEKNRSLRHVKYKVAKDLSFSSPEKCLKILNTRPNKEVSNDLADKYGECIKSHFPKDVLSSYYAAQVKVFPSGYITMNRKDGGLTHDVRDLDSATISWHASPEDNYNTIHADVIEWAVDDVR
ncbi:MAG: hypothetical protein NZ735_07295 [Candidatus Marinimicrobia bacterium]|nr:hypothetical protein [Candidatus Neomarinimicrobiota bacterium]